MNVNKNHILNRPDSHECEGCRLPNTVVTRQRYATIQEHNKRIKLETTCRDEEKNESTSRRGDPDDTRVCTPEVACGPPTGEDIQQDSLEQTVSSIICGNIQAGTPVLTDVTAKDNMIVVKINQVCQLQRLAQGTNEEHLRYAAFGPTIIEVRHPQGVQELSAQGKIFLDGVNQTPSTCQTKGMNQRPEIEKSISIFVTIIHRKRKVKLTISNSLLVSVFLRHPKGQLKTHRRSFKTELSRESHTVQKGLNELIPIETSRRGNPCFRDYVTNDSVLVGLMVSFDTNQDITK